MCVDMVIICAWSWNDLIVYSAPFSLDFTFSWGILCVHCYGDVSRGGGGVSIKIRLCTPFASLEAANMKTNVQVFEHWLQQCLLLC